MRQIRVHPRVGVGIVWRGIHASSGWKPLPAPGETEGSARLGPIVGSVDWMVREGRHKAGTYRNLMGLEEPGWNKPARLGTCHEYRHTVDEACCRTGGVAGAEPPQKGGRLRPTTQNCSGQWLVVSCQRLRCPCIRGESEMCAAPPLPEAWESSYPIWDAPPNQAWLTSDHFWRNIGGRKGEL